MTHNTPDPEMYRVTKALSQREVEQADLYERQLAIARAAEDRKPTEAELDELEQIGSTMAANTREIVEYRRMLGAQPNGRLTPPSAPSDRYAGATVGRGGLRFRDLHTGSVVRALARDEKLTAPAGLDDVSPGNLIRAWVTGRHDFLSDAEQRIHNAATVGTDDGGGYLAPEGLSTRFVDLAREASVCVRAGAETLPMMTSELHIAELTGDPTAAWRAETQAITASTPTFGRITLRPKVLAALVPVSIELLEDAPNAGQIIEAALQSVLGAKLDQACLLGSGAGSEPRGVKNHPSANTVASVGAPADYTDLSGAIRQILDANYNGPIEDLAWILNPRTGEQYDELQDTTNQPLMPSRWVSQLRPFSTTSLSTTEGAGSNEASMIVGHFPQMVIGMRTQGVRVDILDSGTATDAGSVSHNATTQLLRHIRVFLRADVALLRPTWFTVLSGITTS